MLSAHYRCNFLQDDRIIDTKPIEGIDDAAALIEADRLLTGSECHSIELWDGDRRIAILSRDARPPSWLAHPS